MTKYRIGDEVTVRGIIKNIEHSRGLSLFVNMGYAEVWLSKSDIVTHTPKQREFKPGDEVKHTYTRDKTYEFLGRFGGKAIIGYLSGNGCPVVAWTEENQLRHADEAE